jgi:hypothetical protein
VLASRLIAGVTLLWLAAAPLAQAQIAAGDSAEAGEPALSVTTMVFCAGVKSMTPVAVADTFPKDIYSVYCFTRIVGAREATSVIHRWQHGDSTFAGIELPVKSPLWRTWSSKRMHPGLRGEWKVDVTELDGTVIHSGTFVLE